MRLEFTQMYKNQRVCDVILTDSGCDIVKRYPDVQPYKLLFNLDSYSYDTALQILESRLWNKKHEYLSELWGVNREDVISCIQVTHGVFTTDKFWFLFEGEHLRWEDIRARG